MLMAGLLVFVALLGLIAGLVLLTPATWGVGVLAGSGVLAILARIAQADAQHKQVMTALGQRRSRAPSRPVPVRQEQSPIEGWE